MDQIYTRMAQSKKIRMFLSIIRINIVMLFISNDNIRQKYTNIFLIKNK